MTINRQPDRLLTMKTKTKTKTKTNRIKDKDVERVNGKRVRCYDNGGRTFDRYTVVYLDEPETPETRKDYECYACLGMSERPSHPQGFGQHSVAMVGRHLGKRIRFATLPPDCQTLVENDCK